MFAGDLMEKMRAEGLDCSRNRLHGATKAGVFKPVPVRTSIGFYQYKPIHARQFRDYLTTRRVGPRASHMELTEREQNEERLRKLREEKAERQNQLDTALDQLAPLEQREKLRERQTIGP